MSSTFNTSHLPRGLAVGRAGTGGNDLWHEITELPGGRIGVAIGRRAGRGNRSLPADLRAALRIGADPATALVDVASAASAAICAVIDPPASTVSYSTIGDLVPVIAGPHDTHRVLDAAAGSVGTATLPPGDTLLLCTRAVEQAGTLLDECASEPPGQAMAHIVGALNLVADLDSLIAVLYRQAPGPLDITLPADPANLAVVRNRLRHWLALAGVTAEDCADALLAVGEAASNATEHSVLGVSHPVTLSVHASIAGGRLRFTVSDNGRWRPPGDSTAHRGHGMKLINALVDAADLTAGEHGTTVDMLKETRP